MFNFIESLFDIAFWSFHNPPVEDPYNRRRWIIVDRSRPGRLPYVGIYCWLAKVPRGRVYFRREVAEADAEKLRSVSPCQFEIVEVPPNR